MLTSPQFKQMQWIAVVAAPWQLMNPILTLSKTVLFQDKIRHSSNPNKLLVSSLPQVLSWGLSSNTIKATTCWSLVCLGTSKRKEGKWGQRMCVTSSRHSNLPRLWTQKTSLLVISPNRSNLICLLSHKDSGSINLLELTLPKELFLQMKTPIWQKRSQSMQLQSNFRHQRLTFSSFSAPCLRNHTSSSQTKTRIKSLRGVSKSHRAWSPNWRHF